MISPVTIPNWSFSGTWPGISHLESLILQGEEVTKEFYNCFGLWREYVNIITDAGTTKNTYFRTDMLNSIDRYLDELIDTKPQNLLKTLRDFYPLFHSYQTQVSEIENIILGNLSNQELGKYFAILRSLQSQIIIYDQFGIISEKYFTAKAKTYLNVDSVEGFETFLVLTNPHTHTSLQKEQMAVYKVANKLLSDPKFRKACLSRSRKMIRMLVIKEVLSDIQNLAQSFGWIPVYLHSPEWDEGYYIRRIMDVCIQNVSEHGSSLNEKTDKIRNQPTINHKKCDQLIAELNIPKVNQTFFEIFRLVMDTRNESAYGVGFASRVVNQILEEASIRLDMPISTLHLLYQDEVVSLLEGKCSVSDIPIKSRKRISGYWFNEQQGFIKLGEEDCLTFFDAQQTSSDSNTKQLEDITKGMCASVGTASGVSCVVLNSNDFGKFKAGNILIAKSTTVDFVPLMRQASGIITEFGGITSHAAIIARELGIPAIVGYKDATSVFKDGENLEFDASNRTITRLLTPPNIAST